MLEKALTYNPWPLGHIPEELQRPELRQLKEVGYQFDDAREVVDIFEKKVAAFAGSKYAVAVDCCSHAIELCLHYGLEDGMLDRERVYVLPDNTYTSVYQTMKNLGLAVMLMRKQWSGVYQIEGSGIVDGAVRWKEGMYLQNGLFQCLSFQIKKPIPIGRGGMILLDSKEAYDWFCLMRYDARDMALPYDHPKHVVGVGWHYYMTPEDAARGILLMDKVTFRGDSANSSNYPSLSKMMGKKLYE